MAQPNALTRPAFNRGVTMPNFPTRSPSDAYPVDTTWGTAASHLHHGEYSRRVLGKGEYTATVATPLDSPSLPSTSPSSPTSSTDTSPVQFPTLTASDQANFYHSMGPLQRSPSSSSNYARNTTLPSISSSSHSNTRSPHNQLNIELETSNAQHTLLAPLGTGFHSDCITIAARKGNVLVIVADRWELEKDCHYEWQVQFDRDADMSKIHASFDRGLLKVTVQRIRPFGERPS